MNILVRFKWYREHRMTKLVRKIGGYEVKLAGMTARHDLITAMIGRVNSYPERYFDEQADLTQRIGEVEKLLDLLYKAHATLVESHKGIEQLKVQREVAERGPGR